MNSRPGCGSIFNSPYCDLIWIAQHEHLEAPIEQFRISRIMCAHKNSAYKTPCIKGQHSVDFGRGCVGRNEDAGHHPLTRSPINDRSPRPDYDEVEFLT